MDVNTSAVNPGFLKMLKDPEETLVVDANFYIPPDRTNLGARSSYSFEEFQNIWIEPMHRLFPNIAAHEAVIQELVTSASARLTEAFVSASEPPKLMVLSESSLSPWEQAICRQKEVLIARYTQYVPGLDNKDDRGEVKTLAYMGTVGLLFSHQMMQMHSV